MIMQKSQIQKFRFSSTLKEPSTVFTGIAKKDPILIK